MALEEPQERNITLSIRRLADEFAMARETVSKRLAEYSVAPCGRRHGHPVYRLRDAAPAIVGVGITDEDGNRDPRMLPPEKRNAYYQSELRRLEFEMETGQLVPAAQHEAAVADLARDVVQFLTTLPDELERDAGLTPEQIEAMHASIDRSRQGLYETLTADKDEDAASA